MPRFALSLALFAITAGPVLFAGPGFGFDVEVHGNQYFAEILTDPSSYEALLVVTFEAPTCPLTENSLVVSALEVNPADPTLRDRLPAGFFIPARFPVLITVDQGTVTFTRSFDVELVTPNLDFRANSPWRLLKAPNGGQFEDITRSIGLGSFRALGKSGSFSEFVIAADLRPQVSVIEAKIQNLQTRLDDGNGSEITPGAYFLLDGQLDRIRSDHAGGDLPLAIQRTKTMLDTVESEADAGNIDDTSLGGSLSGELLGAIESLGFSLELARLEDNDRIEVLERAVVAPGGRSLTVRVLFSGLQALELDNLAVTAEDVDPHDMDLLARLPAGVVIPSEFPVLVHVDPGAKDEQAFSGMFEIELLTDGLSFTANTPYRLFKAPNGGLFTDITETYGLGSFRVLGGSDSFSELMILRDLRSNADVLTAKFLTLRAIRAAHQDDIDSGVSAQLGMLLDDAETAYLGNDLALALAKLDASRDLVETRSGRGVPAIWVSTAGVTRVNVAAKLLSAVATTRFSLVIEGSPALDPADANGDGVVDALDVFYLINRVFPGGGSP